MFPALPRGVLTASLSAILLTSVSGQAVLTVGPEPTDDFLNLASAVAAAPPGATILCRHSTSLPLLDKPLRILGDGDVTLYNFAPGTMIRGVDSGEVLIQGFAVGFAQPITIEDCAAPVTLADIGRGTSDLFIPRPSARPAVLVRNADAVTILDCSLGGAVVSGGAADPGLDLVDSTVVVQGSDLRGWDPDGSFLYFDAGGPGVALENSTLHLLDTDVQGSCALFNQFTDVRHAGGNGIQIDASSRVTARETTFSGGQRTFDLDGNEVPGGVDIVLEPGGILDQQPGPAYGLDMPRLVREGETLTYALSGPVGAAALLAFSTSAGHLDVPGIVDPLLIGGAFDVVPVGSIPVGGLMITSIPAPLLPSVDAATFYVQLLGAHGGPSGFTVFAGDAQASTLVDAAF